MSIFIYPLFQTYAADIFFAQTWKDNRLRLPENMTSEYRYVKSSWFNLKNIFCHFKTEFIYSQASHSRSWISCFVPYMLILFSYFSCKVLTYILLAKLAISDNGLNSMPKSTRRCDCSLLNILDTLRHNDKVRTNDNEINRTRSSWASSTILSIPATTTRHTTDFEIVNLHQRFTYLTGYCPATNL